VSASAALAEPIPCEVLVHPVGQLVAVRKFPPPPHLLGPTQEPSLATPPSLTLAEPWPPALHFLNGGGGRDPSDVPPTPHHGVTAMAVSPSGKVVAVCERLRPRPAPMGRRWGGPASSQPPSARSSARGSARSSARGSARSSRSGEDEMNSFDPNACSCRVSVYLLSTGQLLRTLECPTSGLDWGSVAFGPDSTTLATVSDGPGAEGAAVVLWRWRERLEPEGSLHGAAASNEKPASTTTSASKAPQVGRLASGVVPERSKLNRVRFMPAPTGGNEADEPPPALTTSGGGHLGLWRYPQPKDHSFGAEDSDGSGEEEDHFGSYGGSPKAMLGSNLTASSSAVPLLPLHVGVPEEPVKLELRSLVGPLPASEASVGVADHCWLTLQSPGAAPYPLLVAVTDRDGRPRSTGSAPQGRRRSSAQQGQSPKGIRSSISGGDAAAAAGGGPPVSPASRSPALGGAFFNGNSPGNNGGRNSGDGTDSASVYCFDWQGDSVCGNPDLEPPSGRSLLLPGAGAPALVLPLRPLPPQVAPGSSSSASGGEPQADEVAATAMCPTPDGFVVCGCGGLVAVVRVSVALPEPIPAESESASASSAGGAAAAGESLESGDGDEEVVVELVKQLAPTLSLVGLLRVGAGVPGAVLGPNGFPAQLGRSSPTASPLPSSKPPPLPADAPLGHRWFVGCSFLPIRNEVLLYTMANQLVTVPMAAIESAGDGTPQGDTDAIQRITSEHETAAAQARSEGKVIPSSASPVVSTPLIHGPHSSPILAVSAATDVPLSATVGADGWVRVWNYLRGSCEVATKFPGDEPLCTSVHPAGTLVAVGFRDRLKLMSLLHAPPSLHARHEWLVKGVRALSFSPSGDVLAAAVGINVCLYDPFTLAQRGPPLMGHIKPVRALCWSNNGQRLWSSGNDGNVFGWELFDSKEPGKRLDDAQLLNRSKGYHALLVCREDDALPVLLPPTSPDDEDQAYAGFAASSAVLVPSPGGGGAKAAAAAGVPPPSASNPRSSSAMESSRRSSAANTSRSSDPNCNRNQTSNGGGSSPGVVLGSVCVAAGAEGGLREVRWNQSLSDSHVVIDYPGPVHTSLALDTAHAALYAGLADGRMRVYKWPLGAYAGTFREVPLHGGARPQDKDQGLQQSHHVQPPPLSDAGAGGGVGGLCVVRNGQMVLSGGGDGAFMACAVQLVEPPAFDGTQRVTRQVWDCRPLNAREALAEHNADRRLASIEWLADLKRREADLHKATTDLKSDLDFGLHQLNTKGAEKLKANALAAAQAQAAAEAASQDMANQIASLSARNAKDAKRNATINTLALEASEEAYEKKLGAAMARYDRLSAKIESTREQAAEAMSHNAATAAKNFKRRERAAARTLRDLEAQVAKLADDCRVHGRFHRASLLQQEAEYEAEITRLTEAATSEVAAQRQATGKTMAHAQLLAGKASQMERRMREGASANEVVASEASAVEAVNAKLAFSMRGLEDEIAVKQEALSKAENLGLVLSEEQKELESFRFVYNSKVSSMEDEAPEMNAQKQRLETAVAELNDILKQEHTDATALAEEQNAQKGEEAKVEQALAEGQRSVKQLDRIAFLFKRDLAELVELGLPPFKLVHGARDLATRYMQDVPPPKPTGAYKDWHIPEQNPATSTSTNTSSHHGASKGASPSGHGAPTAAGATGRVSGGRSGQPKDHEEGIVLADLSSLVAPELVEANQKEEMATVLRLRDLQWGAAESRRAATERLQADHLRSMKARFVEAKMMTDELNTLRRENLRSRREEAALERQVATWQERKKAAKKRGGENGDRQQQQNQPGATSSSSMSLESLRSLNDDDDLSLRSPGSYELQLPSVSEGPSVAATAQFLPSDAENGDGFSLEEDLSVGAATQEGRPPHGLTQKGRQQNGGRAKGDDTSDASTQGPLFPSQWLQASELTEQGKPSALLDPSAGLGPSYALGSPVPPGYVESSSNASGHSSPTNGNDAAIQGNNTSLPVPLLLPLLEVTKKTTVRRAVGGAKSPTEYRAYPPGQAPGSFQQSALQEAENEHDDLLMAVQRSRHAVAAQQAELDELRRLAAQLKVQPRVGPGSSILLGPRPKGSNQSVGGGLRVKRARGPGVGFAHDPARDAAAAAAAAAATGIAAAAAANGAGGGSDGEGGVSGGGSVISISSSGVEGGPSLGAVSMVETVYAPQWDKASGEAAAAPSFDEGSVNSDGRPVSPNVDMESPLKPVNA